MASTTKRFVQAIGLTAGFLAPAAVAQFPLAPEGVTVLDSKFGNGVKISYKEVRHSHSRISELAFKQLLVVGHLEFSN